MADPRARPLGSKTLLTVSDGTLRIGPERLFKGVPLAQSAPLLHSRDESGQALLPMRSLVIRGSGRLIVVDTGLGLHSPLRPAPGTLLLELAAAGIRPDEVTDVIISHAHGDHIGWATIEEERGRRTTFPNARYWMSETEFRHWTEPAQLNAAAAVRVQLPVIAASGQLELVEGEAEIAPGIRLVPTPGHTPGHCSVLITDGADAALFTGDISHHPLHFEKLNWNSEFDTDPVLAYRTRVRVLEQAAADRLLLISYHHPTPFGQAVYNGAAFRWQPV
ncbi:MAG: MBL fold metallo-hydrolase [Chloroflexota bacterium]|nr:MBL fold metallo-hydrolase [Dehalococcoidia bacterium]MDW8253214.1 MBL fold metallo-hydrolase [Chloroflexota bacterium]